MVDNATRIHNWVPLFEDPPGEFRPMPFWGLNDRLDDQELRRQIAEMKSAGWGGFFVHPRTRLETPYLSAEYFQHMRLIVEEAAQQGLQMWMYDEHPFPAGAAGGLLGAEKKSQRHRALAVNSHSRLVPMEEGVAYFRLPVDPLTGITGDPIRVHDLSRESVSDEEYLHFYEWEMQATKTANIENIYAPPLVHGFPYADLLNPSVVRRFLQLVYEPYKKAIGEHFGGTVKGSFSDIPVYLWQYSHAPRPCVPWTPKLPKLFRARYEYDLLDVVPSLFYDVGEYQRVRNDFWRLTSDVFVESYTQQLADWCAGNNLLYTAHYWGEETLHWQVGWTGDVMHHMTKQDVVANDHILRDIEDPAGIKQAATVAEQLGRPRVLTESYALSGHGLTFEERKWIGEWEYVLGTNMLVSYVAAYSFRGGRKRDEPPSEFIQQPYWIHEDRLSTYFGRLGWLLTRGQRVVDVLLMQPLSTAFSLFKPGNEITPAWRPTDDPYEGAGQALFNLSDGYRLATEWLLAEHRDFHYGNEQIIAEHGSGVGDSLRVGLGSYKVVVVPPSLTWNRATVNLLKEFAASGGKIIALGTLPTRIDGDLAGQVLPEQTVHIDATRSDLASALDSMIAADVVIQDADSVLYQHRVDGDSHVWFLVNKDLEESVPEVSVMLREKSANLALEVWNLLDGKRYRLPYVREGEYLTFSLDFAPAGSYMIVGAPPDGHDLPPLPPRATSETSDRVLQLGGEWTLDRLDPNTVTLDYCRVQIGEEAWSDKLPMWRAEQLLARAGMGVRYSLAFEFDVDTLPSALSIAVEDPEKYRVELNGRTVDSAESRAWWDVRLRLLDTPSGLRAGTNTISISGNYGLKSEVEAIHLVGEFDVVSTTPPEIRTSSESPIVIGHNLVDEGLPFFAGRVRLRKEFDIDVVPSSAILEFDEINAITALVKVNREEAGFLPWKPYSVEVGKFMKNGNNVLEVELTSSLHNLLGPHHFDGREARNWVHESAWHDESHWNDDYFFVPFGLRGARIYQRDS